MGILKPLIIGLCVGAGAPSVAAARDVLALERAVTSWDVVPDSQLARLRGGIDFGQGNLVGYFAIARTIEVNGQVVAQMQLVIPNLGSLGAGAVPQISVSGPLAQLIQVINAGSSAAVAGTIAALPIAASSASTASPLASGAAIHGFSVPTPTTGGPTPASVAEAGPGLSTPGAAAALTSTAGQASGTVSTAGQQSGSTAQFGSALSSAVAAAVGATSGSGTGGATASPPSSMTGAAAGPSGASAAPTASAIASSPGISRSSPVSAANNQPQAASAPTVVSSAGASGAPVIVISNLPNAAAITTAVQNEVQATTIQTQTTITAAVGSLSTANALTLASAIQAQVAASLGH